MLIIEDEWLIADYIESLVRRWGATSLEIADSETDAIQAADAHRPAIILSDVKLRSGTGPRAVHAIQERWGLIPVIFITGTPQDCVPCEPSAVILTKPVNPLALAQAFMTFAPAA